MYRHLQVLTGTAGLVAAGALAISITSAAYASPPKQPVERVNETEALKTSANPLHNSDTKTGDNPLYTERHAAPPASNQANVAGDTGAKNDTGSNQRAWPFKGKKLRKLPHDLDTTLDPMDETDPCPTLPCN